MPRVPTVLSLLDLDPRKFGSMEEYAVCLSRSLRERGWRSVLVFARPVPDHLLPAFQQTGATLEVFDRGSARRLYPQLIRLLRKYRAEVVHFHFFDHFSLLPMLPCLAGARMVVFTDHCRTPQPRALTRLKCQAWDRVVLGLLGTRILAVSEHVKRTLVDSYGMAPGRIQVIPNGVNPQRFSGITPEEAARLREELKIPPLSPVVVTAAYLIPEKGIGDLIAAVPQVLKSQPDTVFVIVGDGPLWEPLQQQTRDLGVAASVRFTGLRSDVHRLMALANVVAVPSVWQEPAGLVVIEGMASARPVVATRVGGIPEYLADGVTGLIVEPQNPVQLAQALLRLLDSPALARTFGVAGRERVEELFPMARWVEDTLAIYEPVLAQAASQPAA